MLHEQQLAAASSGEDPSSRQQESGGDFEQAGSASSGPDKFASESARPLILRSMSHSALLSPSSRLRLSSRDNLSVPGAETASELLTPPIHSGDDFAHHDSTLQRPSTHPGSPVRSIGSSSSSPDEKKRRRLERNRMAAKQCRQKKKRYIEQLEVQIAMLRAENQRLREKLGFEG